MADKQAVTEAVNRGGMAYDVADVAALADAFTVDGTFKMTIAGGPEIRFEGREAIRQLFADSLAAQDDQRRHVISNLCFDDETADSITAKSYLTLLVVKDGALTVLSCGMYTDRFVLDSGTWRMRERFLQLDRGY